MDRKPHISQCTRSPPVMSSDYELTLLPSIGAEKSKQQHFVDELPSDVVDTSYDSTYANRLGPSIHQSAGKWLDRWRLGRYFRIHDPEDEASPFRGWRKAVITAAAVTGLVLLVNSIFAIFVTARFGSDDGVGLIYKGDCTLVKRWDTALHLLINLLGTALLAASSFTMQCLSSPTRSEVNEAHKNRVSLDIGLASFKNLFYVKKWKGFLWLLLCFSTMPLHLLWNSTVFSTTGVNYYSYIIATKDFLNGGEYTPYYGTCSSVPTAGLRNVTSMIYQGYEAGHYSHLSAEQCFNAYMTVDFLTSRRNLIVVIQQPTTSMNMSLCGYEGQLWDGKSSVVGIGVDMDPAEKLAMFYPFLDSYNEAGWEQLAANVASTGTWPLGNFTVESCWAEEVGVSQCQLQFISYILYVVVGCNIVKLIAMCMAAKYLWNLDQPIFATVGDAVSSFLQNNDETTKGYCLLDLYAIKEGRWKSSSSGPAYKSIYQRKAKKRLYYATSNARWWWSMTPCTLYLILGFVLFRLSLDDLSYYSLTTAMKMKFGAVDSGLLLHLGGASGGKLLIDVVVANSFQLALSTTYFLYNSLYTAQCAALEWASYIQGNRKSLRVTWPMGQQRSTYYLHLPYRYGIPLTILLILMHFLISQSIFLARLQYYKGDGALTPAGFTDVGFSPRATLTTCLVGVVMILAQILHSFRPLENRIPIHGNNSAVISAMCHTRDDNANDEFGKDSWNQRGPPNLALMPITWGVTRKPIDYGDSSMLQEERSRKGAGHCSFSADVVELPEVGQHYA